MSRFLGNTTRDSNNTSTYSNSIISTSTISGNQGNLVLIEEHQEDVVCYNRQTRQLTFSQINSGQTGATGATGPISVLEVSAFQNSSTGDNGMIISGNNIQLCAASVNTPGAVTTSMQEFGGLKTFENVFINGCLSIDSQVINSSTTIDPSLGSIIFVTQDCTITLPATATPGTIIVIRKTFATFISGPTIIVTTGKKILEGDNGQSNNIVMDTTSKMTSIALYSNPTTLSTSWSVIWEIKN